MKAGHRLPLDKLSVVCFVYVTDSTKEAKDDLRSAVDLEMSYQKKRGLLKYVLQKYQLTRPVEDMTFDDLFDMGIYMIGDPDSVAAKIQQFYEESGGFGTLLLVAGKCWADREKRLRSLRLFAQQVRPRLAHLTAEREPETAAATG